MTKILTTACDDVNDDGNNDEKDAGNSEVARRGTLSRSLFSFAISHLNFVLSHEAKLSGEESADG